MIPPDARRRIESARPDERVSLLVVFLRPTLVEVEHAAAAETTRRGRLECATRLYAEAKRRVADALAATPGVHVEDLPTQPHLAVTASGETWRALARPGALLDQDPDAEVAPDTKYQAY